MAEIVTATDEAVRAVRPRLVGGVLAMVASAVPVVVLALLVRNASGPVARFDQRADVRTTGIALAHPAVRRAAEVGALALHPWVFRTAVIVAAVVLFRRRARAAALWAATTMVVGSLLGVVLKSLVQRARPRLDDPVAAESGFSFPSGHALNAALGVTILLLLLWRPLERAARRGAALAIGVLLVVATSLDRLLLGVHFPTDVVAGDLVGALVAISSWVAFGPVLRERSRREADRATSSGRTA
ncbi:MAG: phosphatase PAP2 family protein [Rhodoferax sp.]|nr:phosphatase PAP2 family protein [Actinomycetota bacterium]